MTKQEEQARNEAIRKMYAGLKIQINTANSAVVYNYADLFIKPVGMRQREHDRFIKKLVTFAAQNGGWQLIHDTENTMQMLSLQKVKEFLLGNLIYPIYCSAYTTKCCNMCTYAYRKQAVNSVDATMFTSISRLEVRLLLCTRFDESFELNEIQCDILTTQ